MHALLTPRERKNGRPHEQHLVAEEAGLGVSLMWLMSNSTQGSCVRRASGRTQQGVDRPKLCVCLDMCVCVCVCLPVVYMCAGTH